MTKIKIGVTSEIGRLDGVIIHTPGPEVENMTPETTKRSLYSDILNLSVVTKEYKQFKRVLNRFTTTFEIRDLLHDVLHNEEVKETLVTRICENEEAYCIKDFLVSLTARDLTRQLLEGVPLVRDNLTKFLSNERYSLQPLHNAFFTRDTCFIFGDEAMVASLASRVREREALIIQTILDHHTALETAKLYPPQPLDARDGVSFEGGDLLVARRDVLLVGVGARTTSLGVDRILDQLKGRPGRTHVIVQELPLKPESFIHLDMVFTFLDRDSCLIYEPVILNRHDLQTVHIEIDNGRVSSICEVRNLLDALNDLGFNLEPVLCGGETDSWTQEREQWHSGANFLALAPGRIIGYGRNTQTLDSLNKHGFEILEAREVLSRKVDPDDYGRFVITIEGAELSRGGGGCRCMTMPLKRNNVDC